MVVLGTMMGNRVLPGPEHSLQMLETKISGAFTFFFPVVEYQYGTLTEVLHPDWRSLLIEPIEHLYFVSNEESKREHWHYHEVTTDRYVLVSGKLRLVLYDARESSPSKGLLIRIDLENSKHSNLLPNGIRIPPGVWHTFRSDAPFNLVNFKTPSYNRSKPDKFLVPLPNQVTEFTWNDDAIDSILE